MCEILPYFCSDEYRTLCVRINLPDVKINVNVIYIAASFPADLNIDLNRSFQEPLADSKTLILGDFDLPDIDWGSDTGG